MNGEEHPLVSPSIQISSTSDDMWHDDLAAPAVAGLAAYFMSLDQYRQQIQVPGSVARNVRDLIRSLAYARSPLQPVVAWNGIDSRQTQCPVRRDAGSSGCPVRNTTSTVIPPQSPPSQGPKSTLSLSSPVSTIAIPSNSSVTFNRDGFVAHFTFHFHTFHFHNGLIHPFGCYHSHSFGSRHTHVLSPWIYRRR
jgi:hypothetical protein